MSVSPSGDFPTLDDVLDVSRALRVLNEQRKSVPPLPPDHREIAALTGDETGPPIYDLAPIWRAAIDDEANPVRIGRRRYFSPRRFIVKDWGRIGAIIQEDGRILVDYVSAFDYVQHLDCRVQSAVNNEFMVRMRAGLDVDPIKYGVHAAKGGSNGLMMALSSHAAAGITVGEYLDAVMDRAKSMASRLDPIAAETLVDLVHKAIIGLEGIVDRSKM